MKRAKNLIIMAAVLAVLVVGYLIWNSLSGRLTDDVETPESESYNVAQISAETLCGLDITVRRRGESAEVTKMSFSLAPDKTRWLWADDNTVPLNNNAFANIVTALNEAVSPYRLTGVDDAKLTEYGLGNPYIEAVFTCTDGSVYSCRIGNLNTFTDLYYFADEAQSGTVYTVPSAVPEALDLTILGMVQYDSLPEIGAAKIKTLSFEKEGKKYVYTSYPEGKDDDYTGAYKWYLSVDGGKEFPVAANFGETLTNAVVYRSLTSCVSYLRSEQAGYGIDDAAAIPVTVDYTATEKVTDSTTGTETEVTADRKYVLYFGGTDPDGDLYVRTQDSDLVYTVSYSDTFKALLGGDMKELRPREILSLDYDRVDKMTFTAGARTLSVEVTHTGDSAVYKDVSGAALDYDKFLALTGKLEQTEASSYTELVEPKGGTDVLFTADFTFNAGEKNGTLTVSAYSDAYCRVSFMGRDDQLITAEAAAGLTAALEAYFG